MKKLFAGLLVLPLFAFVALDWVAVKLDERVTVSFPTNPEKKDMSGNSVWTQDIDKDARVMVMIIDFTKLGADSASIAVEMEKDAALSEFREGVLGQIKGGTLISERKSMINGKRYFEYVINMGKTEQPDAFNMMYSRCIFVGDRLYTLNFYEKNNLPRKEDRDKFFASFKLSY